MWPVFLLGVIFLIAVGFGARRFVSARPGDIAFAVRTFLATVSGLAGTGLLIAGRFGLALILLLAAGLTLRTLRNQRRGADPWDQGGPASSSGSSSVETDLLRMQLDRAQRRSSGRGQDRPVRRAQACLTGPW